MLDSVEKRETLSEMSSGPFGPGPFVPLCPPQSEPLYKGLDETVRDGIKGNQPK
jgi:hypothetical protein